MGQKNIHILETQTSKKVDFSDVKKMDVARLRKFKGFENIEEKEGESVIQQLETLAELLYEQIANE